VSCSELSPAEILAGVNGCESTSDTTPSCVLGDTVPIKILAGLAANNATRYDIGMYISTDMNKPLDVAPPTGAATCAVTGIPVAVSADLDGNTCGDQLAKSALGNVIPLNGTVLCTAGADSQLALNIGASYQQNTGTAANCTFATSPTKVFPGTGSKCNINALTISIDVILPPASVTLVKVLDPTNDPGRFNLFVDAVEASDQTHNGSVTKNNIAADAQVTLNETAGTATDLANYTTSISCATSADAPVAVTGTGPWTITMPSVPVGITCELTNTRKGRSVRLEKDIAPSTDPGLFNLSVNGQTVFTDATNGDAGTLFGVPVGSIVSVSEAGGTGTNLGAYTSSLSCPGVSVSGTNPGTFTLPDADVSCVFTNNRIPPPPPPPVITNIPTLSEWAYLLLGMLLLASGWLYLRRR
jgi:hypothetical protein